MQNAWSLHSDNRSAVIIHRSRTSFTCSNTGPPNQADMGKVPIRLREVVYTLSPFEQTVMNGVFKDVPEKLHRKFSENWVDVGVFFLAPVAATFAYANNFLEKEKQHHRH